MNKLLILLLVLSYHSLWGQDKYLVEYDRINDETKYYSLEYEKGEYKETPLSKAPTVKRGDIIKFRTINTNPLVFNFDIEEPTEIKGNNESITVAVLGGFSGLMGELDGTIGGVSNELYGLQRNTPDAVSFVDRGTEETSVARKKSLEQLISFHSHLKSTYGQLTKYHNSLSAVKSTGLRKEEIIAALKFSVGNFDLKNYMETLRFLDMEYDILKEDPELTDSDLKEVEQTYLKLTTDLNNSLADPQNAQELLGIVSAASFSRETTTVVSYKSGGNFGGQLDRQDNNVSSLTFQLDYRGLSETDYSYKDDNLIQSKTIDLPAQSKSYFSWASGFLMVTPFDGFKNYALEEVGHDSLQVVNGQDLSGSRFTIGTSLLFNFRSKSFIIPHLMLGSSIDFIGESDWDNKSIHFLLGGGCKIKQFPYLSFSGGIAFCRNQELRSGINMNEVYTDDPSGYIDDFTQKTFSPGYFFGININL